MGEEEKPPIQVPEQPAVQTAKKERTPEEMVEIRRKLLEETRTMLPRYKEDGTPFTADEADKIVEAARRRLIDVSNGIISVVHAEGSWHDIDPVERERAFILGSMIRDYDYQRLISAKEDAELPEQLREIYKKNVFTGAGRFDAWLDPKNKVDSVASYRERQSQQPSGPIGNLSGQEGFGGAAPQTKDDSGQQGSTENLTQT